MECGNLFCFWNQRNENPEKGFERRESTNKDFLTIKKEMLCSHPFQRKRECFSMLKVDNWKEKMLQKKNVVEKRRRWSGFTPMPKSTQHNFHYTCNLVLHNALWVIPSSFFLWVVKKSFRIKTGTLTTLSAYCILHTLNSGNLSFNDKRQCTESVALRQVLAPPWAAPCAQWRTRLLRLRSRLVRCFHLASFRVRFSICALRSFPHFIISC